MGVGHGVGKEGGECCGVGKRSRDNDRSSRVTWSGKIEANYDRSLGA